MSFRVLAILIAPFASGVAGTTNFSKLEKFTMGDVDATLTNELLAGAAGQRSINGARIADLETALKPTFASLPKVSGKYLDHQAVRYVLHRFFVQRHGWHIKGLEPGGDASTQDNNKPKEWVPSYLQGRFEASLGHGGGLDLHELATLAAALEDLVRREAAARLHDVYDVLRFPTETGIDKEAAEDAISTYMVIFLVGRNVTMNSPQEAAWKRQKFANKYKGFLEVNTWLQSVERHHISSTGSEHVDFKTAIDVVQEIGEQYGSFNDLECSDLKATLMGIERKSRKAGRVRLADFYNMSLYSHWKFTEKVEYLRTLGALDESNASQPLVIVPNYIGSRPNCLEATSLYAVCCRNECEDLMGHLEQQIVAPAAPPARIASLVAALPSPTVSAPRELSAALLRRLNEIANLNAGEVNLHGRLFAQWMHHAYPRECPYPHETGSINPQTADEWMQKTGHSDTSVSEEERRKIVEDACRFEDGGEAAEAELPWSDAEELLTMTQPSKASASSLMNFLFALVVVNFAILGGLFRKGSRSREQNVLLGICMLACIVYFLDLLDQSAFLFPLVLAAFSLSIRHVAKNRCGGCVDLDMLKSAEKCCV